jgi:hypothetical protein
VTREKLYLNQTILGSSRSKQATVTSDRMKTLILAACLLATINLSVANSVPVFLWGGASENDLPVPTLHQLSESEFSSIVAAKLKPETFTVVFQERKVSLGSSISRRHFDLEKTKFFSHMTNHFLIKFPMFTAFN